MATMKIKNGDTVKVITGKDKGKEGKVIAVKEGKLVVEGINNITKHAKPSQANPKGGIVHEGFSFLLSSAMNRCLFSSAVVVGRPRFARAPRPQRTSMKLRASRCRAESSSRSRSAAVSTQTAKG